MDDHLKQLLLLGREHYQKREYDKAEYLLRQVVEKTDHFADVHRHAGRDRPQPRATSPRPSATSSAPSS